MKNYINGTWSDSSTGRTFANLNPADSTDVIGMFPLSSADDIAAAVGAASAAFRAWRLMPAPKRGDILRKAGYLFSPRQAWMVAILQR